MLGRLAGVSDTAAPRGVLVRRGPAGCLVGQADHRPVQSVSGFPVRAIDTNGAGDTHTGVFIAAIAAGLPVLDAVGRANAAAAMSVTRSGPAASPGRAELDAFLAGQQTRARPGASTAR
jgi:sugar/nucleoside kinase (ribokinase family)